MTSAQHKPIYIFIGPPGVGKGSLARMCKQHNGWCTLSTGDLCRSHIASQTEIGKQIDFCIKSGKLISDKMIVQMVRTWLYDNLNNTQGVILDGFPRTYEQAQSFHQLLQELMLPCYVRVIELRLHDDMIIRRLTNRRVCSNKLCQAVYTYIDSSLAPQQHGVCDVCHATLIQRDDDTDEVIRKRLQTYYETATPLLSFYRERPEFLGALHADKPLSDIYQSFMALQK